MNQIEKNPDIPKVSVIIPTYNYGHFIEKSINSILSQTYTNFETIVVPRCCRWSRIFARYHPWSLPLLPVHLLSLREKLNDYNLEQELRRLAGAFRGCRHRLGHPGLPASSLQGRQHQGTQLSSSRPSIQQPKFYQQGRWIGKCQSFLITGTNVSIANRGSGGWYTFQLPEMVHFYFTIDTRNTNQISHHHR